MSGITLELYKVPSGPSLIHGDTFGTLKVEAFTGIVIVLPVHCECVVSSEMGMYYVQR